MRDSILPLKMNQVSLTVGDRRLVDDISLEITAGDPTVIIGPNGAGKSLVLRLAYGLVQPTSGSIHYNSQLGTDASSRKAFVFQRPVLLRRSTRGNIEFVLSVLGVPFRERRHRADVALELVGLQDVARAPARTLSVGEQQRLALARAWVVEPELLFLDEPTASLDVAACAQVEELIARFVETGVKILLTTHDHAQARRLAADVVFLHHGKLVECSRADTFFENPDTAPARAFLEGELHW